MAITTLPAETKGTLMLFSLPAKGIIHQNIISQLMVIAALMHCTCFPPPLVGGVMEASSALWVSSPGSFWEMVSKKQHILVPVLQLHQ